jgi:hypothetical protein
MEKLWFVYAFVEGKYTLVGTVLSPREESGRFPGAAEKAAAKFGKCDVVPGGPSCRPRVGNLPR